MEDHLQNFHHHRLIPAACKPHFRMYEKEDSFMDATLEEKMDAAEQRGRDYFRQGLNCT